MGWKSQVNRTGRAVPMCVWEPWSLQPGFTTMWPPLTSTLISGAWTMSSRGSSSWTIEWWEINQKKSAELESQWLQVSQTATLVFLAVWHGWHAGYYVTFFNEFIVISFEKDFSTVWNKSVRVARCWLRNSYMWEWMFQPGFVLLMSIFAGGRSILLTPLSPPPLAGKWCHFIGSGFLISLFWQVLCVLLPTPLLPGLPSSWMESLLAGLSGQLGFWC